MSLVTGSMLKARHFWQSSPAYLLIVGLMAVLVLAACAKVVTEDEAQPAITRQTIAPSEIAVVKAEDRATIQAPEPAAVPPEPTAVADMGGPATEEPPTPAAEATPTQEEPDKSQLSDDEAAPDYGITEFLRESVTEGEGVWPFVSLDDPSFLTADEATYLEPLDLVLGVSMNGEHKAYPTSLMWFHHVPNDIVGGQPVAVTY